MKAKKYKHLSFKDRCVIEEFLNNNYNFTKIGNRIGKDRTTISHEVKKHRFLREQLIIVIICHVVLKINLLMFAMDALNLIIAKKYVILILMMLLIMNIKNL